MSIFITGNYDGIVNQRLRFMKVISQRCLKICYEQLPQLHSNKKKNGTHAEPLTHSISTRIETCSNFRLVFNYSKYSLSGLYKT